MGLQEGFLHRLRDLNIESTYIQRKSPFCPVMKQTIVQERWIRARKAIFILFSRQFHDPISKHNFDNSWNVRGMDEGRMIRLVSRIEMSSNTALHHNGQQKIAGKINESRKKNVANYTVRIRQNLFQIKISGFHWLMFGAMSCCAVSCGAMSFDIPTLDPTIMPGWNGEF